MMRLLALALLLPACADDGAPPLSMGSSGDPTSTGDVDPGSGPTTASTTSAGTADTAASTTGTTGDTDAPFSHLASTVITEDGRLALQSNLPPAVADCMALAGAPCDDADADGLVDVWEDVVLDLLRPRRRMDEAEQFFTDATATAGDVGRVVAVDDRVRLFVMLGYSRDYGSCAGLSSHNGDSERVVVDLAPWPEGDVGGVVFEQAYLAAHEGTTADASQMFVGPEVADLVVEVDPNTAEPRWIVYPSADKHGTYATIEICEDASAIPCFEEDCAPDGVDDPLAYDLLPLFVNAGEPEAPRADDLAVVGFPGESAWGEAPFCGGLGGSNCPPSVREKLLTDPF